MIVVTVARRPVSEGTVAANVLAHGTGAIHISACRVGSGRWPANVVLQHEAGCQDGKCDPACVVTHVDAQSGETKSSGFGGRQVIKRSTGRKPIGQAENVVYGAESRPEGSVMQTYDDEGGASRFFQQVKG